MKTPLSTRLVNQDFTICIILGALNDILALKIESIVQAIVISRIDYCNRPLYGVVATNLSKLQRVQNAAVLLVFSLPRHEHITSSFIRLHWLPIKLRINFKIAMLYFKCIYGPIIKKDGQHQEGFDSLFVCIRQDLEQSPAIIKVTAKFQHL